MHDDLGFAEALKGSEPVCGGKAGKGNAQITQRLRGVRGVGQRKNARVPHLSSRRCEERWDVSSPDDRVSA